VLLAARVANRAPGFESLPLTPHVELIYSRQVDPDRLVSAAHIAVRGALFTTCRDSTVAIEVLGQRPVTEADSVRTDYRRPWSSFTRQPLASGMPDSLHRLVTIAPSSPLPPDCKHTLLVPGEVTTARTTYQAIEFSTHGVFVLAKVTVMCPAYESCQDGTLHLEFSTPVDRDEVQHHVHIPGLTTTFLGDTDTPLIDWYLQLQGAKPHQYSVELDTALRDIYHQRPAAPLHHVFQARGDPMAWLASQSQIVTVERSFATLPIWSRGTDTVFVSTRAVPDAMIGSALQGAMSSGRDRIIGLPAGALRRPLAVHPDSSGGPTATPFSLGPPGHLPSGFLALHLQPGKSGNRSQERPTTWLIQVTDLAVEAKVSRDRALVWVTGLADGRPRPHARVAFDDYSGHVIGSAETDSDGVATIALPIADSAANTGPFGRTGYILATLAGDRAVVATGDWNGSLSPWTLGGRGDSSPDDAAAVFTDRGIYRPGESVHIAAIVRHGQLGVLRAPVPGTRMRLQVERQGDESPAIDTTVALDEFGFVDVGWATGPSSATGEYTARIDELEEGRQDLPIGESSFSLAEYRAPTFTATVSADTSRLWYAGDTLTATIGARYLYGAPMARAAASWSTRFEPLNQWEWHIPGYESWMIGPGSAAAPPASRSSFGLDTLDSAGTGRVRLRIPDDALERPGRLTIEAAVTDLDRQQVATRTSVRVDPAEFYLAARLAGTRWSLPLDSAVTVDVAAVRPDGTPLGVVIVTGVVVRESLMGRVGDAAVDTVARCRIRTTQGVGQCVFTPRETGRYEVDLAARDSARHRVRTTFSRWAFGERRESRVVRELWDRNYRMVLTADRERYAVGDTATVVVAAPWDTTDAWVSIEREGVIEQRLHRLIGRAPTLRVPIDSAFAPNVFVGVVAVRGRTAAPSDTADPGAPALRAGYVELSVAPDLHRLTVDVRPARREYGPGDSARIDVHVSDKGGRPSAAEVALWAVDEGVLSLTQYASPDPLAELYQARGLGATLWSDLDGLVLQYALRDSVRLESGTFGKGGGAVAPSAATFVKMESALVTGLAGATPVRSSFATTAFFLTRLRTDAAGHVEAQVRLPDNLTTFRVIAVAVTAGDLYGAGEAPLVVTKALVTRPALPRFVRAGDAFTAGAVITRRDGAAVPVRVGAAGVGIVLTGDSAHADTLDAGRGREVAFSWHVPDRSSADSVRVELRATDGAHADAVRMSLPVKPTYHPRAWTATGRLSDTMTVAMALPAGMDVARSRLLLDFGSSPLTVVRGIARTLHVYPYYCTEQVVSAAMPLLALWRAQRLLGDTIAPPDAAEQLGTAVAILVGRQRTDGGIGYWGADDWTTPWLSTYAGLFLIAARDAGIPVDRQALERLKHYLEEGQSAGQRDTVPRWRWREEIAALEFLAAVGDAQPEREKAVLAARSQLAIEDRARLAELIRRRRPDEALSLMRDVWNGVRVEGRRAVLDDPTGRGWAYFPSTMRPVAQVLHATMTIAPTNPLIGPLSESLIQHARAVPWWNTQDYAFTVWALSAFADLEQLDASRAVDIRQGGHLVLHVVAPPRAGTQVALPLTGLVQGSSSAPVLTLKLTTPQTGPGTFFYLTVDEVPLDRPTHPDSRGLAVERWYERFADGSPVVSATAGELVRVRVRITATSERQFVVVDDALPAGLEAVNADLRTTATLSTATPDTIANLDQDELVDEQSWRWRSGWWWGSWTHRELRDDRVVFSAPELLPGTYLLTYLARATTPGTFVRPPAHAEEMYNPAVHGRSDGGVFVVRAP